MYTHGNLSHPVLKAPTFLWQEKLLYCKSIKILAAQLSCLHVNIIIIIIIITIYIALISWAHGALQCINSNFVTVKNSKFGKISTQPHTLILYMHHYHTNPVPETNRVWDTKWMYN